MSNEIELKIRIKKSTYEQLEKLANFIEIENILSGSDEQNVTLEDLVRAAIIDYINAQFYGKRKDDEWLYNVKNNKEYKLKNRFKEYIDSKKVTYTEVLTQVGLPKSTFSQILSNNHEISLRHFLLIWSYLGYPQIEEILYFDKRGDKPSREKHITL